MIIHVDVHFTDKCNIAPVSVHTPVSFVCLFGLRLYIPVNNFSVMSGRSHRFLGITSTFWEGNVPCSRIQHGDPSEDHAPTSHFDPLPLGLLRPLVQTSTVTVATASVSVYRAVFALSGDNVDQKTVSTVIVFI